MAERTPLNGQALNPDIIEIKAITWNKDSHGLFDYESKSCFHHKFKVLPSDVHIFRSLEAPEVYVANNRHDLEKYSTENRQLISKLKLRKGQPGGCSVGKVDLIAELPRQTPKDTESMATEESAPLQSPDDLHIIVRSLKNNDGSNKGYSLQIGEQIRLGRISYTVIEMNTHGKVEYSEGNINSFFKNGTKFEDMEKPQPGSLCKICMQQTQCSTNFLVAPCRCIGSCQFVHLECLRRWIESKVKKEVVGGTICYNFDKFECEICKAELPKYIMKNGVHELLKVERPINSSYLILEECGKGKKDMIVIQNVPEDGIKIGRGHQCDIRVADISVSRLHAFIKIQNGRFVLFDNESKFGTLVRVRKNMPIDFDKKAFQAGRTVLTMKMKRTRPSHNGQMQVETSPTR